MIIMMFVWDSKLDKLCSCRFVNFYKDYVDHVTMIEGVEEKTS